MARPSPETWANALSLYVPNAQFSSDVGTDGIFYADLGAPIALSAAGILSAQSIAAAATVVAANFVGGFVQTAFGRYGRNVTMVASGAATSTVRVDGRDYLGQKMSETFTLNGAVTVAGKKAFFRVDQVVILTTTAATTINVGWGDILGLPYKTDALLSQLIDKTVVAAGTFVDGVETDPGTATTGDPRGTWLPPTATNGTRVYAVIGRADKTELYGVEHFSA